MCQNNWKNFRGPTFGDYIPVTSILVATSSSCFEQIYIFYKFYPVKETFLSESIPYLRQIFNSSSQKQLHITKPIFVCCISLKAGIWT